MQQVDPISLRPPRPAHARSSRRWAPQMPSAERSRGAPLVLTVLFVLLVLYTGRLGPLVGDAMLVVLLVQACRFDMAFPRNAAAVLTALVLVLATVQVAGEVAGGVRDREMLIINLGAIYFAGFAFGVYALLRRWEQRDGRPRVWATISAALWRVVPLLVVAVALLAVRLVVAPTLGESLPPILRPIVYVHTAVIAPTLTLILPLLTSAPEGTVARRWRRPLVGAWLMATLVFASEGRAVALGVGIGLAVVYLRPARLIRVGYFGAVLMFVLWSTGAAVEVGEREVSFDGFVEAAASLVDAEVESEGNLTDTREWRTEWWSRIVDDIRDGPFVFSGHGWGESLGDQYDINQPRISRDPDSLLVHFPHNLFLGLASLGGVVLAVSFLAVPVLTLVRRSRDEERPAVPMLVAFKAALVTVLAVSATGVLVEGSQGGALFWILIGFVWWATAAAADIDGRAVSRAERSGPGGRRRQALKER